LTLRTLHVHALKLLWALPLAGLVPGCLLVSPLEKYTGASGGSPGEGGAPSIGKEAGAGVGGGVPDGSRGCTSNKECSRADADLPNRCRPADGVCVRLRTDECPVSFGDANDPNAIFFGAFASLESATPPADTAVVRAHRLALEELSGDSAAGLPGGPRGTRRPLVMIVCDNHRAVVDKGLSHLADDVQVPAVLATLMPGDLLRGFEAHRERNMFFLSPVGATSTVVNEDDAPPGGERDSAGLIWTMLGQPSDLAPAYARVLSLEENYAKKLPDVGERPLRVALVTTTEAFDSELANAVAPLLRFNEKSAAENGDRYQGFTVDPADPNLEETGRRIVNFRPDIVISTAGSVFTQSGGILATIEVLWEDNSTVDVGTVGRPMYILSPTNAGDLNGVQTLMKNLIEGGRGREPDANRRFIGISGAGAEDKTLQNAFASRLGTRFQNVNVESGTYYDSLYFLAYAMYGAGAPPLTGPAIAGGMLRLLQGQRYGVGPDDINSVFEALDDGATIELDTTQGPPTFNRATGTRIDDGSVYCFENSPTAGLRLRSEVLRYHHESGELTGGPFCFPGFFP
jgi:branched-chain amino acid transport system substrate-binding protein